MSARGRRLALRTLVFNHMRITHRLGLGAPLPQKQAPGSANRSELDSNNRLRKHLLGADRRKAPDKPLTPSNTYSKEASSRRPTEAASDLEPDMEESRSSLGKRKRKTAPEDGDADAQNTSQEAVELKKKHNRGKNAGQSFLDELLSKRSRKKT